MATKLDLSLLKKFSPFTQLSKSQLNELLSSCEVLSVPAKRQIFKRGIHHRHSYYLLKGSITLSDTDFRTTKISADMKQAKHPLELSNISLQSAIANNECELLAIEKDRVDLVLTWSEAGSYLSTEIETGNGGVCNSQEDSELESDEETDWMSSLLQASLFQSIPPANLQQLFVKFKAIEVQKGDVIIKEAGYGEEFYVIASGKAEVRRKMGSNCEELALARLEPGQFFGQEALIGETTRNASVVMLSDGKLMALDKDDFKHLLQKPVLSYLNSEHVNELTMSDTKVQQIDVRLPIEYKLSKPQLGRNIPLSSLRNALNELDEDTTYVVSCDGGRRSELGAYLISEAGHTAYVLRESLN